MGKAMNVLVAVIALAAMLHTTEAEEYELAWSIPSGGAGTYEAWAAEHTFEISVDSITFEFPAGEQDLALVTKEDFDSCTTTHPILETTKPVNVGIVQPGTFYFICTFAGHCEKGQKIAANWTNSSAAAPAPCPSSTATTYSALPLKFLSKRVNKHGSKKKVSLTLGGAI
ncbi:umecyanin-like [Rosa chinensis]|uniref:umecyanin-like n=1 Tax=Rosa chinensis TaxID=74649 RepID=UPI000D0947DC|nr:umecyanin-like [Rosa chinensis]